MYLSELLLLLLLLFLSLSLLMVKEAAGQQMFTCLVSLAQDREPKT